MSTCIQVAPKSTRTHGAPKSTRTQVKSHPSQLVPKSWTRTQINSFTSQLLPKSIRTKSTRTKVAPNAHLSQLAPRSTCTQAAPRSTFTQINLQPSHLAPKYLSTHALVNTHPSQQVNSLNDNTFWVLGDMEQESEEKNFKKLGGGGGDSIYLPTSLPPYLPSNTTCRPT